jgi:hypothetical protein
MEADILQIEARNEHYATDMASLSDFRWRPAGTVDAGCIVHRPHITLYCLDDEHRRAVFVETPPDLDLRQAAFYYQAQFHNAQRLLTISYDTLHRLAGQVGDQFQNLILTYSVGRCGSTLLSRAFNRVDSVLDLSEPEVYMHITALRPRDGSRDAELRQLLQSCTRLLYKPTGAQTTLAIKFRSFSIEIADLLYLVYPQAKILFLYRDAETWSRSQAKAFDVFSSEAVELRDKTLEKNPEFVRRTTPLTSEHVRRHIRRSLSPKDYVALVALALAQRVPFVRDRVPTPLHYVEPYIRSFPIAKLMVLQWLSVMHRYLELNARGIPMLAVRYETLVSAPRAALQALFEYCGLPLDQLPAAEAAFAEDSQRGSNLARDRLAGADRSELAPEHLSQLREVLLEHPTIRKPDFIVPNTIAV